MFIFGSTLPEGKRWNYRPVHTLTNVPYAFLLLKSCKY